MREERELSTHESAYLGKCVAARYMIPLRTIAIQNLYTHRDSSECEVFDPTLIEEATSLNSANGLGDDPGTAFVDQHHWRKKGAGHPPSRLKLLRTDKVSREQCSFIETFTGLEKLYFIGPHPQEKRVKATTPNGTPLPNSPASSQSSSSSCNTDGAGAMSLKDDYIKAITKNHGRTLKHLLLLPQWHVTDDDIALIVRQCPNLEQLGICAEHSNLKTVRLFLPFLNDLIALRILSSPDDTTFLDKMREADEKGIHEKMLSEETAKWNSSKLQYIEVGGDDLIFKIGKRETGCKKLVKKTTREEVKDIAIWALDCHEI